MDALSGRLRKAHCVKPTRMGASPNSDAGSRLGARVTGPVTCDRTGHKNRWAGDRHGWGPTFFQIESTNGVPTLADALANKDTMIIPRVSTLRLVARFAEPGRWMYQCHILEHADGGMMGELDVEESAE